AGEVTSFYNMLVDEARGQSLEPFYQLAPRRLRGHIELVYDYYNRPTIRFYESLLYESPCYNPGIQSFRLFRHTNESSWPFIMNTPRLVRDDEIDFARPFISSEADEFFKLDLTRQPLGYIREVLGLTQSRDDQLLKLLSTDEAQPYKKWTD